MAGPWCHKDAMHRCPSVGVGRTREEREEEGGRERKRERVSERGRRCPRAKKGGQESGTYYCSLLFEKHSLCAEA